MDIIKQDLLINCIYLQDFDTGHFSTLYQPYQSYLLQHTYQTVIIDFKYKKAANLLFDNVLYMGYMKKNYTKEIFSI